MVSTEFTTVMKLLLWISPPISRSLELLQLRKPFSYLKCCICFLNLCPQGLLKVLPIATTSNIYANASILLQKPPKPGKTTTKSVPTAVTDTDTYFHKALYFSKETVFLSMMTLLAMIVLILIFKYVIFFWNHSRY